ncbi:MAG: DegT/DnrJ/EryC1/StrS family aminotransferase [Flavobacteriales bacterium]
MIPIAKPFLDELEAKAAHDTILTGWITQGPRVQEFEEKFAAYTGSQYAVAVSNCTTGLHLAMIVAGVGAGDEVICPSMSYIATANCIVYCGAQPVFAEINPHTYNLDIDDVKKRITPKTKAILLVHQIGMPADIDAFSSLAKEKNLILIEDAACAAGSAYKGKKIGSHSDLVCFSFHPRKVISTGDGGMVTTSREDFAARMKLLRQHGMSVTDRARHGSSKVIFEDHLEVAYNYRLTDIQAAVGIQQLAKLDDIVNGRRKIAQRYAQLLGDIDCVRLPQEPEGCFSNWQSYSIYLLPNAPIERNELMQRMLDSGVSTRRGIMTSHRETAYTKRDGITSLPITEDACDRSIIIPLFVPMSDDDVNTVASTFRKYLLG